MLAPSITLLQWFNLAGLGGVRTNVAYSVAAGATENTTIQPPSNYPYLYIAYLQFDGALSGLVGFNVVFGADQVGGWAIQAIPMPVDLIGQGVATVTVQNASTQSVLVNVVYVAVSENAFRALHAMNERGQ